MECGRSNYTGNGAVQKEVNVDVNAKLGPNKEHSNLSSGTS